MRSVVEGYLQRWLDHTELLTADSTDAFCVFLYDLLKKARNVEKRRQHDIQSTVTAKLEAVVGFLRNFDGKPS